MLIILTMILRQKCSLQLSRLKQSIQNIFLQTGSQLGLIVPPPLSFPKINKAAQSLINHCVQANADQCFQI